MKKVLVAALAVALAVVMTIPASAFENEFGGYFRVRAYNNSNFDGLKDNAADEGENDLQVVDARTRLYYTAKFSDDLKFVNKFEIDTTWGDDSTGDVGADGKEFEVKNSYLDMKLGDVSVKAGTHYGFVGRGLVFDDDFSGLTISHDLGSFSWIKVVEGGAGKDKNDHDLDAYVVSSVFKAGNITINPFLMYTTSKDAVDHNILPSTMGYDDFKITRMEDMNVYDLGFSVDMVVGNANLWFTGVYQGGDLKATIIEDENVLESGKDYDLSSYIVALGGNAEVAGVDLHGQVLYASGDDDDDDEIGFHLDVTGGEFYGWSEIMGEGVFDAAVSDGSPGTDLANLTAINLGASMSPMEKLTVGADVWYATLNEDIENSEDKKESYLGTEIDLSMCYKVMDNVKLDVIAAYLFAGEATGSGDEDPYEVGAQLSLSF